MKFRFTFILLLLCAQCIANRADSVRNYYLFKNKAEIFIIDSGYVEGLACYKKAFTYKSPNVSDLYNALILAYHLKDSVSAKLYYDQMSFHGLDKKKSERREWVLSVKNEPLYQWISKDYDSLYWAGAGTHMLPYAKVMDSLSAVDDTLRKWKAFNPTEEETSALMHGDSINMLFLDQYIGEHGFPSYDRIGSFEVTLNGWFDSPNTFWFLLWHSRHTSTFLNETLLEAVKCGDFIPDEYALLIDMQLDTSIYYTAFPRRIGDDNKIEFLPVPNADAVNAKRASIYLDTLANYEKKLRFARDEGKPVVFHIVPFWVMACNLAPVDMRSWKKMTK